MLDGYIKSKSGRFCAAIFALCLLLRFIEYFLIETDRTVVGENVLHKACGIVVLAAALFGVWHIVMPIKSCVDGDMTPVSAVLMSVGYIILAGIMGIKWGLLSRVTGSLWVGLGDHLLNNTVATNMLHVVSQNGADELQIVRILIAQLISFALVLIIYRRERKKAAV